MSITTYTPSDIIIDIGGYRLTDWMSITIIPNEKRFTQYRGIMGKNTRVRNSDSSATILLSVIQSGKANEVFSRILALDEMYETARLEVYCKDLNGGGVFSTSTAYLTGEPDIVYSGELNERVWEIVCDDVDSLPTPNSNNITSDVMKFVTGLF